MVSFIYMILNLPFPKCGRFWVYFGTHSLPPAWAWWACAGWATPRTRAAAAGPPAWCWRNNIQRTAETVPEDKPRYSGSTCNTPALTHTSPGSLYVDWSGSYFSPEREDDQPGEHEGHREEDKDGVTGARPASVIKHLPRLTETERTRKPHFHKQLHAQFHRSSLHRLKAFAQNCRNFMEPWKIFFSY